MPQNHDVIRLSEKEKRAVQKAIPRLFSKWGLTVGESAAALGLTNHGWLIFQDLDAPLPNDDLGSKCSHLLAIHRALSIIFTEPAAQGRWMRAANTGFGFPLRRPIDILAQDGVPGFARVRSHLAAVAMGA